jgi:gliding motility-associated lipoprotein GldH
MLIILSSCSNDIVYKHKEKLDGTWDYTKELVYKIPVNDTLVKYDLIARVTHSDDFSYQNFYVDLRTSFPDGKSLNDDVSFQLADGMGSWQGRCSGSTCKVDLLLQPSFRFQQIGDYEIGIKNNSRVELEGVEAVELILAKTYLKKEE